MPRELEYQEGQPIPPGYQLRPAVRKSMVVTGLALFGGLWAASTVLGASLDSSSSRTCAFGPSGPVSCKTDDYRPMYIPLAGPFITIATAHADSSGGLALGVIGVGQVVGAGLLIAGLANPTKKLVRDDVVAMTRPTVRPVVGPMSAGLAGTF
jgi:hypothetical protein